MDRALNEILKGKVDGIEGVVYAQLLECMTSHLRLLGHCVSRKTVACHRRIPNRSDLDIDAVELLEYAINTRWEPVMGPSEPLIEIPTRMSWLSECVPHPVLPLPPPHTWKADLVPLHPHSSGPDSRLQHFNVSLACHSGLSHLLSDPPVNYLSSRQSRSVLLLKSQHVA